MASNNQFTSKTKNSDNSSESNSRNNIRDNYSANNRNNNRSANNNNFNNRHRNTNNQQNNDNDSFLSDHLRDHDHRSGSNVNNLPNPNPQPNNNYQPNNNSRPNQSRPNQNSRPKKTESNDHAHEDRNNISNRKNKDDSNSNSPPENSSFGEQRRRRKQLLSTCSNNSTANNCICCLHEIQTYVYYSCLHVVCLDCSVKMRVICQKTDCPICRQESPHVLCTKKPLSQSESQENITSLIKNCKNVLRCFSDISPMPAGSVPELDKDEFMKIRNSGMNFNEDIIRKEYTDILTSQCDDCGENFKSFDDLESHVRRAHKKFFCELCLNNLMLFPYERKYYSREDLAQHKRKGDRGDYAFKGHPLCEYCDQRFLDRDNLYRHFRRDHYYCHFCDSDGQEDYYADYAHLRMHFLKAHYLCELDDCSKNSAQTHEYVVFRNDLDLQAHKKQKHAKSRSEARNYGKLNIEFNTLRAAGPSGGGRESGGGGGSGRGEGGRGKGRGNQRSDNYNNERNQDRQGLGHHSHSAQDFNEYSNRRKNNDNDRIDPDILRVSRAQYAREDESRKKEEHRQNLKEQYEKYEYDQASAQPVPHISLISDNDKKVKNDKPDLFPKLPEPEEIEEPVGMWRNVIGQGNAPKINKEAEFPSLGGMASNNIPSIGPFQKKQTTSAWSSKNPQPAPDFGTTFTTKMGLSKKQAKKERLKVAQESELAEKNKIVQVNEISKSSDMTNLTNRLNLHAISAASVSPVTSNMQGLKKYLEKSPKTEVDNQNVEITSRETPKSSRSKSPEKKSNSPSFTNDDFPAPPGFDTNNKKKINTPPGFGKSTPPGFDNQPKNPPPVEELKTDYIKPEDYTKRNQFLTMKLTDLFGVNNEVEFGKFKEVSMEFQKNNLNATEYLTRCQKILQMLSQAYQPSFIKFFDLVQEMIVLLPDSNKQQELYTAYIKVIDNNKSRASNMKLTNKLSGCQFCTQYFLNNEFNFHQLDNHKKEMADYYNVTPNQSNLKKVEKQKKASGSASEDFPSLLSTVKPVKPVIKTTVIKEIPKNSDDFPSLLATVEPKTNKPAKSFKESYVFAKKSDYQYQSNEIEKPSISTNDSNDFPSLGAYVSSTVIKTKSSQFSAAISTEKPKKENKQVEKKKVNSEDDFPSLCTGFVSSSEQRFSTMPTASIFANPSSHLSVLNKKKHRLQK